MNITMKRVLGRKVMTNLDSILKSRDRWEGGLGWGTHVTPWLIHVNVWQNPLQYCKVISLQLIKINGKKKKSRDITLPTKVHLGKAMVFLVVMYGCESWTIKKAEHRRMDAFEVWCWRRLLRVPWTARRSNQSFLKEISPEYSLEELMLKLKLQYFGHLIWRTDSFEKTLIAGKDWRQEEKGTTEDELVGWHHWLNGHEFE